MNGDRLRDTPCHQTRRPQKLVTAYPILWVWRIEANRRSCSARIILETHVSHNLKYPSNTRQRNKDTVGLTLTKFSHLNDPAFSSAWVCNSWCMYPAVFLPSLENHVNFLLTVGSFSFSFGVLSFEPSFWRNPFLSENRDPWTGRDLTFSFGAPSS